MLDLVSSCESLPKPVVDSELRPDLKSSPHRIDDAKSGPVFEATEVRSKMSMSESFVGSKSEPCLVPWSELIACMRLGPHFEEKELDSKLGPDFGSEPDQVDKSKSRPNFRHS